MVSVSFNWAGWGHGSPETYGPVGFESFYISHTILFLNFLFIIYNKQNTVYVILVIGLPVFCES